MTQTYRAPRARLISTGSEILQGLYADTNARDLSRMLLEAGFRVAGHAAVPDDEGEIAGALEFASRDAGLVVTTGGLGPTEDDLLRFAVAKVWGRELARDGKAVEMMQERFRQRGAEMPERNAVQADLPVGSTPLYNHWGTAPGFFLPGGEGRGGLLALPGPPGEMRPMMRAAFKEVLLPIFPGLPARLVHSIHIAMIGESAVNEVLRDLIRDHGDGREVTILASRGHLRLRLVVDGKDADDARARLEDLRGEVLQRLDERVIFAEGGEDTPLAEGVLRELQAQQATIALAESCTGGGIARAITAIPGSSESFLAGYVTYSNEAKQRDLGAPAGLIAQHGAVSEPVARAMAEGAKARTGATWAVAVTGVAGPGGGTEAKPVGTVWFAVAGPMDCTAHRRFFPGDREAVQHWSTMEALELLRRRLVGLDPDQRSPEKK